MRFYLTNLGKDCFILGYPFLWEFNPRIDWKTGRLLEGNVEIETMRFDHTQKLVTKVQGQARRMCRDPAKRMALFVRKTTFSQRFAKEARQKGKDKETKEIPMEYQRHWKVFDSTVAEHFPPQREEDLKIELLPGAPTAINCKVYPLNTKETGILREFLQEEERKGYITQGSSPYMAPVFFIRKKNLDELRPVMDYREINKWMKQNHNPLPNIQTALENLREGELYSKFDIRWGYKNLRIRKEDQHKAVFKMMFGTYVPKVTYFGLTNTPPTFQRIIHQDLRPILQKYPRAFGNYLDDTWIVTRKTPEGRALHRQITHELFDLLENKSYFLKLGKCQFEQESMDLPGWTVGNGEI